MTGRYITRGAGKLVRVTLDDGSDLVGTAQHPIWSESRRAWTPLGELLPGEQLRGRAGPLAVLSVEPLPGVADVYNLEIHGQHVYAITAAGVLVHNAGLDDCGGAVARSTANVSELRGRQFGNEFSGSELKRLKKSMRRNGFDPEHPVEIAIVDGRKIIIDGHHRARAAGAVGLREVPVVIRSIEPERARQLIEEAIAAAENLGLPW